MPSASLVRSAALLAVALLVVPVGLGLGSSAPSVLGLPSAAPSVPASIPSPLPPSSGASAGSPVSERVGALESALRAHDVPAQDAAIPDLAAEAPGRAGPVQPSYTQGPAPMGISDLGLRNTSHGLGAYVYNTSSVWGSVDLLRAQSAYLDGAGPDSFSIELNAVATNVTLAGVTGYEFWTEELATYTSSTHALTFGDNVWNFSSPAGTIASDAFAAHGPNGTVIAPYFYYAVGPTVTVPYPFTVNLYLNASTVGGHPAVFFNYTVTNGSGRLAHGSFDDVVFASGTATPSAAPAFQVNGTGVDPVGLPNDIELVLVGPGEGVTTTFFSINATAALRTWNANAAGYRVVPAAYDAGSDTGETSDGILPVYRAPSLGGPPTVSLGPGPSFVDGLWNVSSALNGSRPYALLQTPTNAFLFVNPGKSYNASEAEWVPTALPTAGISDFSLPCLGNFTFRWMLSGWGVRTMTVNGTTACLPISPTTLIVTLAPQATPTAYTPLLAWGNSELGAVNQSGNGSAANPYVLFHRAGGVLNAVFGQLNDLGFPVFEGVLLINTSAHVEVVAPTVALGYGAWMATELAELGFPATNLLQLEFWNVSNVSVEDSTDVSGWIPALAGEFPVGEVTFWGSRGNLVAGNTFHDQGVALALYGGTNNTVWGNTVLAATVRASFDDGNDTTGVLEAESGDLVYNNFLTVPRPAVTPTYLPESCLVTCDPSPISDTWNVSLRPASASLRVLGVTLTGSVLHTTYQGGNYWSNYGTPADPYGVLPYNDGGRITHGGDYVPLTVSTIYSVTFNESGLVAGAPWNVTVLGVTNASTSTSLTLDEPNGTYNATVGAPTGYVGPSVVPFTVNGSNVVVAVNFTELFPVTLHEVGLVPGDGWSVWFNVTAGSTGRNASASSTGTSLAVDLENGTYGLAFAAYGYTVVHGGGHLTVSGAARSRTVTFALVPILSVTASGLAANAPWTVTVAQGGANVSETLVGDGTIVFTVLELDPGPYAWSVSAPNYVATPSVGSGDAPTAVAATVAFVANPGPAPAPDWLWAVVGALAAVAAIGFALLALERRRSRRPPKPIVPAAAVAPGAGTATATPAAPPPTASPWAETPADKERPPAGEPWEEQPSDSEQSAPYGRRS